MADHAEDGRWCRVGAGRRLPAVLAVGLVGVMVTGTLGSAAAQAPPPTGLTHAHAAVASHPVPTAATAGSTSDAVGKPDYQQVKKELARYIRALMAENRTAGLAIALVDGQRVVWRKGFGYADVAAGRKVTPRTIFHIGSVSKTFTAAAVMQLVERGLVDLDAPLARYVPKFSLRHRFSGKNVITVRSVLDHHAGIPGTLPKGFITTGKPDRGYQRYLLRTLRHQYPTARVNTVGAYDNSGYALLGKLVRHVTGMNLEAYAQRYLFAPMSMTSSSYDDRLAPRARLTRNYQAVYDDQGEAVRLVAEPREYVNVGGAGSITSTARDLTGYLTMLVSKGRGSAGRVLEPAGLRTMWTRQTSLPLDRWSCCSALGWTRTLPQLDWAGPVLYKGGDTQWAHAMVMVLPKSGLAVAVLTNTTSGEVRGPVAAKALELAYTAKTGRHAPGDDRLPVSPEVSVPQPTLQAYAGPYATSTGLDRVQVATGGAGLVWTRDAGTPAATSALFTPSKDGWFRSATDPTQVRFRTVQGRRILLTRMLAEFVPPTLTRYTDIAGEQVRARSIPAAWSARLGTYRALGVRKRDSIVARTVTLRESDGVLVLDLGGERQVLHATSNKLAFTVGLGGPLPAVGKGDSVQLLRHNRFSYLGVRYQRVPSGAVPSRVAASLHDEHDGAGHRVDEGR